MFEDATFLVTRFRNELDELHNAVRVHWNRVSKALGALDGFDWTVWKNSMNKDDEPFP